MRVALIILMVVWVVLMGVTVAKPQTPDPCAQQLHEMNTRAHIQAEKISNKDVIKDVDRTVQAIVEYENCRARAH